MKKFDFWIVLVLVILLACISKGFDKKPGNAQMSIGSTTYP